jgi:NADP-reducing hydrogenase subunit HndB
MKYFSEENMILINDLKKIKEDTIKKMSMSEVEEGFRIVVGMATCGITAGAKPVYESLLTLINKLELNNVSVVQVGCIGECALEPIVEVYDAQQNRTTYCKVKENDAERIINHHILAKEVVEDLLISKHRI